MPRTTLSDDTFKIEKGVPLPSKETTSSKYPFEKMEIGDSFAVTTEQNRAVSASASYHGKIARQRFSVRRNDRDGSYRCWRIA